MSIITHSQRYLHNCHHVYVIYLLFAYSEINFLDIRYNVYFILF